MRPLAAAIALALVASLPAYAHDRSGRSTPVVPLAPATDEGENPYLESDKLFLWRLHWINHMEIQSGEMAKTRGSADVAALASTLAQDHRRLENSLLQLASRKRLELELTSEEYRRVREPLARQMTAAMDLAHEKGDAFDGAYLTRTADEHLAAIHLMRTYWGRTNDDDIRAFIDRTLPTLQRHHRIAEELLAKTREERQFVRGTEAAAKRKGTIGTSASSKTTEVRPFDKPEEGPDKQEDLKRKIEERFEPQRDPIDRVDPN